MELDVSQILCNRDINRTNAIIVLGQCISTIVIKHSHQGEILCRNCKMHGCISALKEMKIIDVLLNLLH